MHYLDRMLYEPEPEPEFSRYNFTSFDGSYSDAGPYGEPLQYLEEQVPDDESQFFFLQDEADDTFFSRAWYMYSSSNELTDQQGANHDKIEPPPSESGFGSYFVTCWEEGLLPYDYSYDAYAEKADNDDYSEVAPDFHKDDQWHWHDPPGFDFAYGISEYYHQDQESDKSQTPYDNEWNETRLWESLFGHSPCLVRLDQESQESITNQ